MQAFVAVLLIAAVSGQMTTGVNRNVFDFIKYRQMYPTTMTTTTTTPTMDVITQQLIQQLTGLKMKTGVPTTTVYGDLTTLNGQEQQQQYLPSTFQFNIPSDVTLYTYTLRQLVSLPVFGDYLTLPLFRQFVQTPAFQLYLTSGEFQKFFTQPIFRQFFVDPVLFYKYIYPVVQQYQQYYIQHQQYINQGVIPTGLDQQQQTIVIRGQQGQIIPQIYNYNTIKPITTQTTVGQLNNGQFLDTAATTVFGRQVPVTTTYNNQLFNNNNNLYTNFLYKTLLRNMINKNVNYNNVVVPQMYNNDVLVNNKQFVDTTTVPQFYGKQTTLFNNNVNTKNILDLLVGDNTNTNTYTNTINKVFPVYGQEQQMFNTVQQKTVPVTATYTNFLTGNQQQQVGVKTMTTDDLYLESIIKDLVQGKIDINDLKTNLVNADKLNKIVDPVTGDIKIVEEKMVKPVETVLVEGEMTNKDALIKKIILNKAIFNKL